MRAPTSDSLSEPPQPAATPSLSLPHSDPFPISSPCFYLPLSSCPPSPFLCSLMFLLSSLCTRTWLSYDRHTQAHDGHTDQRIPSLQSLLRQRIPPQPLLGQKPAAADADTLTMTATAPPPANGHSHMLMTRGMHIITPIDTVIVLRTSLLPVCVCTCVENQHGYRMNGIGTRVSAICRLKSVCICLCHCTIEEKSPCPYSCIFQKKMSSHT